MGTLVKAITCLCVLVSIQAPADEVLVKVKKTKGTRAATFSLMNAYGVRIQKEYSLVPGLMRVDVGSDTETTKRINALIGSGYFEYVQPNSVRWPQTLENPFAVSGSVVVDPPIVFKEKTRTWVRDPKDYLNYGTSQNNTREVWSQLGQIGSPKTVIAILDTGVDYSHEDLAANMWRNLGEVGLDAQGHAKQTNGIDDDGNGYIDDVYGYDFINKDSFPYDDHGHGTHVAGLAAAVGGNGYGTAGQCPNCSIMALKFISSEGWGTDADAIEAIEYAIKMGATIINSSWGGTEWNQALFDAFKAASAAGVINVVAAGNQGKNIDHDIGNQYPAEFSLPGLFTVAALYEVQGTVTWWSNYGPQSVHLSTAGDSIYSTYPGGKFVSMSGTSMASPGVAGCIGLIKSEMPGINFTQLEMLLKKNIIPDRRSISMVKYHGRPDMLKIIKQLRKQK